MTTPPTTDPPPPVVSSPSAATKKRKRPAKKKTAAPVRPSSTTPPAQHVLVIDNGGDSLRYGWLEDPQPHTMPNVTARLQQQWTTLAGDELGKVTNPSSLIGMTRSTERGVIVHLGNQVQVWKRVLENSGVTVPLTTDTAAALGWKAPRGAEAPKIMPSACAILLGVAPHTPRSILDQILHSWFEDFGFGHVGLYSSPVAAGRLVRNDYETAMLVDCGWSATHLVPLFRQRPIVEAMRRMPLGGRHLIAMYRYYTSYRQYNLMDQEWILRDVLEQTAYVESDFGAAMEAARRMPAGQRPFDRLFVLPDFIHTFRGRAQLPPALQENNEDQDEDEDDEDVNEMMEAENSHEEDEEAVDSEEETLDQKRQRLLKQRADEERRRREQEEMQQNLQLSVERFAVPETLFRPSDSGLPTDWAGLPMAIVQSIQACPKYLQPALYRSVHLVGGLSQLPGLKDRLFHELRALAPCEYDVQLNVADSPQNQAWLGAQRLAQDDQQSWSVSREEWEKSAKRGAWKRLMDDQGSQVLV